MGCCFGLDGAPPRLKATGKGTISPFDFHEVPNPGDDVPLPHYYPIRQDVGGLMFTRADDPTKLNKYAVITVHFICKTAGVHAAFPESKIVVFEMQQVEEGKNFTISNKREWFEGWKLSDLEKLEFGTEKPISAVVLGDEIKVKARQRKIDASSVKFTFKGRGAPLILYGPAAAIEEEIKETKEQIESEEPLKDNDGELITFSMHKGMMMGAMRDAADKRAENPRIERCKRCNGSGKTGPKLQFRCTQCQGQGSRIR